MKLAPRINLLTLGVADVERAAQFYERLGWQRSGASQPAIAFFALDGLVLALFGRGELAEDAGVELADAGFSACSLAHNFGSEAEVDAAFQLALDSGARAVQPPRKVFWGGYSGYFADPDGHLWEVAFNPLMPLDARGRMVLPD